MKAPLTFHSDLIQATFYWKEDRIAHQIEWFDQQRSVVRLESVEGTPVENWPTSPPWQEINIHQSDEDSVLALLVGASGKSHFSASVSIDLTRGIVAYDIACRAKEQPERLGNEYLVASSNAGEKGLFEPINNCQARFTEQPKNPKQSSYDLSKLSITADYRAETDWPQTVQWQFQLTMPG